MEKHITINAESRKEEKIVGILNPLK